MSDILYNSAKFFDGAVKYNYVLNVAHSKKQLIINMGLIEDEFTHIIGLDHLKDIDAFSSKNTKIKISTFEEILSGKISYSDITKSDFFYQPFPKTYNSATKSEYTLAERISVIENIEKILDKAYTGKLYKWDVKRAIIEMPDGKKRHTNINGDYMLAIPSERNPDEKIYLFLYRDTTSKREKNTTEQVYVFSAFADCLDLSKGQERPYTILQEVKENLKTKKTEVLYTHPSYKENKSSQIQHPNNIKQIKFDNPTPQNIIHNNSGTAAAVLPAPNPFKNIINSLKNLFKRQDKHTTASKDVEETGKSDIPESEAIVEKSNVSKEMSAMTEAREAFAAGNLSQEEYQKSVRQYLYSLHGKEEWMEAAETLRKQLDERPNMIRFIGYELKCVEVHIEKHYAPKPKQTLDEIKRAAHEYIKQQNKNKTAEKEISEVKDRYIR